MGLQVCLIKHMKENSPIQYLSKCEDVQTRDFTKRKEHYFIPWKMNTSEKGLP